MKPRARPPRLSAVYNLEKDPIDLSDELEPGPPLTLQERFTGLPEPEPLHSTSRIFGHSFAAWPLMLLLVVLIVGIAAAVETVGEGVFQTYATRIHI